MARKNTRKWDNVVAQAPRVLTKQERIDTVQVMAEYQIEYSKENVKRQFSRIISLMDDAKRDIIRYMERDGADDNFVDLASWSMNTVENMLRNINAANLIKDIARYEAGVAALEVITVIKSFDEQPEAAERSAE